MEIIKKLHSMTCLASFTTDEFNVCKETFTKLAWITCCQSRNEGNKHKLVHDSTLWCMCSYSNLHPSTNRKHFRAFVYVWNGAFSVGNGNVSLLMWRVTVQSLIQLFFMFWCAFVYVSVFSSSRYCKSDQTYLYSYFLWLERIIMGLEILKRARRHIKTWQLRQNSLRLFTVTRHMSGEYISVSNGKRLDSNVKKRAKMFAVCAWMQIAVTPPFCW
jgi:hypothetical protein